MSLVVLGQRGHKFWDTATYQCRITWLSWDRKDLKAWDELLGFWDVLGCPGEERTCDTAGWLGCPWCSGTEKTRKTTAELLMEEC